MPTFLLQPLLIRLNVIHFFFYEILKITHYTPNDTESSLVSCCSGTKWQPPTAMVKQHTIFEAYQHGIGGLSTPYWRPFGRVYREVPNVRPLRNFFFELPPIVDDSGF